MKPTIVVLSLFVLFITILATLADDMSDRPTSNRKHSKDPRDMTDADVERLLDEWEENDEPLEPDELPEYLRPSQKIDLSMLDPSDPDYLLKLTKRGRAVMLFVDIIEDISVEQAEVIAGIWQTSLQNNHIIAERYPLSKRRYIFMFREGPQAVDAKNFLLQQPELSHVTLEGQIFYRSPQQQPIKSDSRANRERKETEDKEDKRDKKDKKAKHVTIEL